MVWCYNMLSYYIMVWYTVSYVLWRDILWCHILRCDIIWCHILWCDIIWCHSVNLVGWFSKVDPQDRFASGDCVTHAVKMLQGLWSSRTLRWLATLLITDVSKSLTVFVFSRSKTQCPQDGRYVNLKHRNTLQIFVQLV